MMAMVGCRWFTGYKPCGKSEDCSDYCPSLEIPRARVLIIHLEALGAVLRSTALLPAIRRRFPEAHITWVTSRAARPLLDGNPLVDRVLSRDEGDLLALSALEFDAAFVVDKSLQAAGVLARTRADLVFGFRADARTGSIVPATGAAEELWRLGLSDRAKFRENRKPETQLACEALELGPWRRDPYVFRLSEAERRLAAERRRQIARGDKEAFVVGVNTGCSAAIPYKKLSIEAQRLLVSRLTAVSGVRVALLGGGEDELRNQRIAHGLEAFETPTGRGLRDGAVSVAACDAVITGDSLGLHLAIALEKPAIAWFGPTCEQEIDLYGRGRKVLSSAPCSPCWKRSCEKPTMCYDLVSVDELIEAALEFRPARGRSDRPARPSSAFFPAAVRAEARSGPLESEMPECQRNAES